MARGSHRVQRWSWGCGRQSSGDAGREPCEQQHGLSGHPAHFQIPGPSSPSAGECNTSCSRPASTFHKQKCSPFLQLLVKTHIYQERPWYRSLISCPILFFLLKEQIQFLEEEIQSLEESELSLSSYSDWYSSTHKNFKNVATKIDRVDKATMGKKMKTLEVGGHTLDLSPNLGSCTLLALSPAQVLGACVLILFPRRSDGLWLTLPSRYYVVISVRPKVGFRWFVMWFHLNDSDFVAQVWIPVWRLIKKKIISNSWHHVLTKEFLLRSLGILLRMRRRSGFCFCCCCFKSLIWK